MKKRKTIIEKNPWFSFVVSIIAKGINGLRTPHSNCTHSHRKEHTHNNKKKKYEAKPLPFLWDYYLHSRTPFMSPGLIISYILFYLPIVWSRFSVFYLPYFGFFFTLLIYYICCDWNHWKHNSVGKCDDNPKPFICNQQTHTRWKNKKKCEKSFEVLWFFLYRLGLL